MSARDCTGPGGRGCPCPGHELRRVDARRHGRKKRDAELKVRRRASTRCPLRGCGARLEQVIGPLGQVDDVCRRCERRLAGVCQDCPAPVAGMVGRALRCEPHKLAHHRDNDRRWIANPENRDRKNANYRKRTTGNVEWRKKKTAARRRWAAANPDKVKKARRREALKEGPVRERRLEYYRRKNLEPVRHEKRLAQARQRYYEQHPERPKCECTGCGVKIEWRGTGRPCLTCDNCCTPAELRRRHWQRAKRAAAREQRQERAA